MIQPNQLAFTYCGTLFTYTCSEHTSLRIEMSTGEIIESNEFLISPEISAEIFSRSGGVREVQVQYPVR